MLPVFQILIYTDVTRMETITGLSVMITMECVSVLFRMEQKFREQRSEGIQTVPEVANLVFTFTIYCTEQACTWSFFLTTSCSII